MLGPQNGGYARIPQTTPDDSTPATWNRQVDVASANDPSVDSDLQAALAASLHNDCQTPHRVDFTDTPEDFNAQVAAGKAMSLLTKRTQGFCEVEADSVYGIALAMPQLARTAKWSLRYTGLAISGFVFLLVNVFIQGYFLYMLSKEERVFMKFGGQMHLCNFGAGLGDRCPGGPDCTGPGGTDYTYPRLFSWELWSTRVVLHDALKKLFPDKVRDIDEHIDPGEYGMESYYLRALCCFLFVVVCWNDLYGTTEIIRLLWNVPSHGEPWMKYEVPAWTPDKDYAKALRDWSELDLVKFRVAGMPRHWKAINIFCVLLPKVYIWLLTVDTGIVYLMETAGIEELIVNAVAMAFILSIDELICDTLISPVMRQMLCRLEPFPLYDAVGEENETEKESFDRHQVDKAFRIFGPYLLWNVMPFRLIAMVVFTYFFLTKYYLENCIHTEDGSWISKPVINPDPGGKLPFSTFLFGPIPTVGGLEGAGGTLWSMPAATVDAV